MVNFKELHADRFICFRMASSVHIIGVAVPDTHRLPNVVQSHDQVAASCFSQHNLPIISKPGTLPSRRGNRIIRVFRGLFPVGSSGARKAARQLSKNRNASDSELENLSKLLDDDNNAMVKFRPHHEAVEGLNNEPRLLLSTAAPCSVSTSCLETCEQPSNANVRMMWRAQPLHRVRIIIGRIFGIAGQSLRAMGRQMSPQGTYTY